jgi:uncharacterized protein
MTTAPRRDDGATLTVRGRASSFAQPDEARCAFTVSAVHEAAAAAIDDVTTRAETLAAVLDELDIAAADRFTSAVTVADQIEYRDGAAVVVGRRASLRVEVRVKATAIVGRLLRAAVDRAGADVDGPRWIVAADSSDQLEAYRSAARDARRRAEAYAEGVGAQVGRVTEMREHEAELFPRFPSARAAAAPADVPIEAGELEVLAAVTVTFALET